MEKGNQLLPYYLFLMFKNVINLLLHEHVEIRCQGQLSPLLSGSETGPLPKPRLALTRLTGQQAPEIPCLHLPQQELEVHRITTSYLNGFCRMKQKSLFFSQQAFTNWEFVHPPQPCLRHYYFLHFRVNPKMKQKVWHTHFKKEAMGIAISCKQKCQNNHYREAEF